MTTLEFIEKSRKIHGDKYNYSKVDYKNNKTKVCIICPEHGEFWQVPSSHLIGKGCSKCGTINSSNKQKRTKEEFIRRAREVHGWKYDYSKVEYVNDKTKVCIICPKHGEFWQSPNNHLKGKGCPYCYGNNKKNNFSFIEESQKIHGNKYDYSKVEYKNTDTKVCIICPKHGEFSQTPYKHLCGQGCPKCGGTQKLNIEEFLCKSRKIHGDKYDYSKVEYINNETKVCIICPKHGEFWQSPNKHLLGQNCPKCKESHYEEKCRLFLEEKNIDYITEKKFDWLGQQRLDFYLPQRNIAIEVQGEQHFFPINWCKNKEKAISQFNKIKLNDKLKKDKCIENGVILYYINYYDDIKQKLKKIIENDV